MLFNHLINKLQRIRFQRKFAQIDPTSGFGDIGFGDHCRLVGNKQMHIGKGSWFGRGSEVFVYNANARLQVGDYTHVNARCRITCAGKIVIGNHVLIAPDVFITDHEHGMDPTLLEGYGNQKLTVRNVVIEDGVWLGQRVCVLSGVTIGAHSIIGANSVVTKNIPPYCIAVGAPARVIKCWNFEAAEWERVK